MKRHLFRLNTVFLALILTSVATLFQCKVLAQTSAGVSGQQFTLIDLTPSALSGALSSIEGGQQAGSAIGFPGGVVAPTSTHAFLWQDGGAAPVDLHPSFMDFPALNAPGNTFAVATDGVFQVGYGFGAATNQRRVALRWSGTPESASVLQPPFNYIHAKALGTGGGQAVGYGLTVVAVNGRGTVRQVGGPLHAVLWDLNTGAGIDLNNGAEATVALACDGSKQVGYGGKMDISGNIVETKAMMWSGSRNNFVWLHPNGFATSQAVAISGPYQVGHAEIQFLVNNKPAFNSRAVIWSGSAASMVELPLPAFAFNFFATGVSFDGRAVGYGFDNAQNQNHALYWASSTSAPVDLNQFLPAGYSNAIATGIDSSGRIAGTAMIGTSQRAVMWVPVP